MKKEKGSVTVITLATVLFILAILSTYLVTTSTKRKSQLAETRILQNAYDGDMAEIYDEVYAGPAIVENVTLIEAKDPNKMNNKTVNSKLEVNKSKKDTAKTTVTIPAGFHLATDTAEVASEGIVIEDKSGNQWVWIPCTIDGAENSIKYDTRTFSRSYPIFSEDENNLYMFSKDKTIEEIEPDEKASIEKYKGFYIGRYEAGEEVSVENRRMRRDGDSCTSNVVVKEGYAPYNYIKCEQANILSSSIADVYGYTGVKTKLCDNHAWDTTLAFIDKTHIDYSITNMTEYMYLSENNWENCFWIESPVTGETIEKNDLGPYQLLYVSDEYLLPTGSFIATGPIPCNLYDIGGNCFEITAKNDNTYMIRGGSYSASPIVMPAAYGTSAYDNNVEVAFRPMLFLE